MTPSKRILHTSAERKDSPHETPSNPCRSRRAERPAAGLARLCAGRGDRAAHPQHPAGRDPVQTSRKDLGQLETSAIGAPYRGVSASDQWLYQARLGGLSVRLCLFTPEGGGVTFQENLCAAQTGGSGDIRLCMRAGSDQGGLLLQMDQHAVDVLRRVGVTEIVLTDMDFYVQETYLVEDLAAMREALSLTSGEQLCLGGEDAPITVVSEDGVRRQIAE